MEPLVVDFDQVAAVVHATHWPVGSPVLRREINRADLGPGGIMAANVVFVFQEPVEVDELAVVARRRAEVNRRCPEQSGYDVVGVPIEEADGLIAALRHRQIEVAASLDDALVAAVGVPDPSEAEVMRQTRRQRLGRRRWACLALLVVAAPVLTIRTATGGRTVDSSGSGRDLAAWFTASCSALVWMTIAAAMLGRGTAGPTSRWRRVYPSFRARRLFVLALLVVLVGPIAGGELLLATTGLPRTMVQGFMLGVPYGTVIGIALRFIKEQRADLSLEG